MQNITNKGGAPSKYKKEYCQKLIEHMKSGGSFTTFAAVVGVCRDTLYEWVHVHDEFSDAKKRAEAYAEKWWEDAAKAGMTGQMKRVVKEEYARNEKGELIYDASGKPVISSREFAPAQFNSTVWVFSMKNRFGWRDKKEITGKDGGALKIEDTRKTAEEIMKDPKLRKLALELAEAMDDDDQAPKGSSGEANS